jgi:hypothetical protein
MIGVMMNSKIKKDIKIMDKFKLVSMMLFRIALVAGIVYLASIGQDGWGWLIFVLLCTL